MTEPGDVQPDASSPHVDDLTESVGADARADHRPAETPASIGRYRVERELGRGGFGIVYLGHDEQLQRAVAVKVPHSRLVSRAEDAAAYLAEARALAALEHPHIAPVHDVGQSDEYPCYIVSKYVDGSSLAERIKKARLAHQEAAKLCVTVAEALHYAHTHGMVHRDVKPGNILLDQSGAPFLVDFGLALRDQDLGKGSRYAGTPAYMSPEQARGEGHRVDGRSDIYSLGAVLYRLLTGHHTFTADSTAELLTLISSQEPKPPRQIDDRIPKELERICLKSLSRRASDRYTTAKDLAVDLQHFVAGHEDSPATIPGAAETAQHLGSDSSTPRSESVAAGSDSQPIRIVPKGLRSFDEHDADFFLELLPGPRDREGLPESIRFWKTRIEETDADKTFSVGLIYGPSGCGKSSLIKAGLLPRLAEHVTSVYVEATANDTETRLLARLRKLCTGLPNDLSLADFLAALRRGEGLPAGKKVLIVLDQFEQWLYAKRNEENAELVQALRQCDGGNVQCVMLVRVDFWMAVTRFLDDLEVGLTRPDNVAAIDLFDARHARRVLAAFGRAYGVLPEDVSQTTDEQKQFLDQAVSGLMEEGKVVCVRLALFAEMTKGKTWTPDTFRDMGGAAGVGAAFLEETFSSDAAVPKHRLHQKAARSVLRALLPESGTDIKGIMRSRNDLREASGYADSDQKFDELIRILDNELRLITPTDPEGAEADEESPGNVDLAGQFYQLTHDYLVPSLREWLTRKQKETRRGRAALRLAERSALWNAKPENRHLPAWWEYLNIRLLTKRQNWTEPQRQMMAKAGRVHGLRWGVALLFAVVLGIAVQRTVSTVRHRNLTERTQTAVAAMSTSRGVLVPRTIEDLQVLPRDMVVQELNDRFADSPESEKLSLAYAMSHFDDVKIDYLVSQIRTASKDEADNLATALGPERKDAVAALRLASDESAADLQHKARLAIIALYLGDITLARDMCQIRTDPSQRTELIHTLSKWHGNVAKLAAVLDESVDAPLRSGVCLGIGGIAAEEVTSELKQAWQPVLFNWYEADSDAGTHSAARWTLNQWQVPLPEIPSSRDPVNGKQWFVNSLNMTMLRIPEGKFFRPLDSKGSEQQEVRLTRPFFLSDGEISVAMFRQFIDDVDYPHEKPSNWEGAVSSVSPTPDHPVQQVNWSDAVMFCNWLSHKEQLPVCYEKHAEDWQPVADVDGYRLPTDAEWEYACRARSETDFTFGNDESLLSSYCVYLASKTQRCGSKLPNAWGLFDMHGNIYEWCQDWYGQYENAAEVVDPAGPSKATGRVSRGGSWSGTARSCRSAIRIGNSPVYRYDGLGFRVARGLSSE